WNCENVAVSRSRFVPISVAREGELFRIRRECIVGWPSKTERRGGVVAGGQVAGISAIRRRYKNVSAFSFLPCVPMSEQQAVGNLRSYFCLRDLFRALLVALVIAAVGVDFGGEGDPFP